MMKFLIACFGLGLGLIGARLSLQSGWSLHSGFAPQTDRGISQLIAGSVLLGSGAILLALVSALGRLDRLIKHVQALSTLSKSAIAQLGQAKSAPQQAEADLASSLPQDIKSEEITKARAGGDKSLSRNQEPAKELPSHDPFAAAFDEAFTAPVRSSAGQDNKERKGLWSLNTGAPKVGASKAVAPNAAAPKAIPKAVPARSAHSKPEPWQRQEPIVPPLMPLIEPVFPQASSNRAQPAPRMASVVTGPWPVSSDESELDAQTNAMSQHLEPEIQANTRMIIRRYDSDGIAYQLFSDGSIEAQTEKGQFKFSGLNELRAFIENRSTLLAS
ncbi:MAG: hypothetical protein EBY21_08055 [Alphaproteobacteria bacterium]|nr:hypothetical protein [Alphaproteobacteria bacterium]